MAALRRARQLGFFGEGPLEAHIQHALGYAQAAETKGWSGRGTFLDLGSGGGLPGLVLIDRWPGSRAVLLDANERRAEHLEQAIAECGWADRARVVHARAEAAGRDPGLRGQLDAVVARSFGPPAALAECAAPFLRVGGLVVVSEPPVVERDAGTAPVLGHPDRWPPEGLHDLGLEAVAFVADGAGFGYQVLRQAAPCPERYPRRDGVPAKRPLF